MRDWSFFPARRSAAAVRGGVRVEALGKNGPAAPYRAEATPFFAARAMPAKFNWPLFSFQVPTIYNMKTSPISGDKKQAVKDEIPLFR
jgi:hypothetical protein